MAKIYTKTAIDKTLILAPREAFIRGFDFGAWTDIRVGMYLSGVDGSVDDSPAVSQTVGLTDAASRLAFGIKNNDSSTLPGETGASFLGISNNASYPAYSSSTSFHAGVSAGRVGVMGIKDTTVLNDTNTSFAELAFPVESSALTSSYCGLYIIRYVVSNAGTAAQSVSVRVYKSSPIAGTDYSASALEIAIGTPAMASGTSVTWNDGVSAYDLPDAFFVRLPFTTSRLRISALMAIKHA